MGGDSIVHCAACRMLCCRGAIYDICERLLVVISFRCLPPVALPGTSLIALFTAGKFVQLPLAQRMKDVRGIAQSLGQVAMDCFVHIPFLYFPAFLLGKDFWLNDNGIRKHGYTAVEEIMLEYKVVPCCEVQRVLT